MILRQYPDPSLKKVAKRIKVFDHKLRQAANSMIDIMKKEQGCGIAAEQVGLDNNLIICWDLDNNKIYCMCNTEIIKQEGQQKGIEGCLSFKNIFKEVTRPYKIVAKYQDLKGKQHILKAEGLLARIVCHEYEHTLGITLADSQEKKFSGVPKV